MKTEDFDVEALFDAVADARNTIVEEGDKPSAEKWSANSVHRQRLFDLVRTKYCLLTGCKSWNFPFSVDGVVLAFLRFRKESKASGRDAELELSGLAD